MATKCNATRCSAIRSSSSQIVNEWEGQTGKYLDSDHYALTERSGMGHVIKQNIRRAISTNR